MYFTSGEIQAYPRFPENLSQGYSSKKRMEGAGRQSIYFEMGCGILGEFICMGCGVVGKYIVQQIKSVYGRIFQFVMQASNLVHILSKHS